MRRDTDKVISTGGVWWSKRRRRADDDNFRRWLPSSSPTLFCWSWWKMMSVTIFSPFLLLVKVFCSHYFLYYLYWAAEKSGKLFLHGWQEIRLSFSRLLFYSSCFSWIHDKKYSHSKQREAPSSEYFQSVYILLLSPKECCCCCPSLCLIVKCFYCWCCLWRRDRDGGSRCLPCNSQLPAQSLVCFFDKEPYLSLVRDR